MNDNREGFENRVQALADIILDDYGKDRVIDRLEMFTRSEDTRLNSSHPTTSRMPSSAWRAHV